MWNLFLPDDIISKNKGKSNGRFDDHLVSFILYIYQNIGGKFVQSPSS